MSKNDRKSYTFSSFDPIMEFNSTTLGKKVIEIRYILSSYVLGAKGDK